MLQLKINPSNLWRRYLPFWIVTLLMLVFSSIATRPNTVHAAPFTCEIGFYQAVDGDLKVMDPDTGNYTTLPNNVTGSVNAIGYNIEDGYIYGLSGAGGAVGHLIRFDSDGSRTDLGLPSGLPANTFVAGDFDTSGNLWVKEFGSSSVLYRVDVSTLTATSLSISTSLNISELVYLNGALYSNSNGTTLYSVSPLTGVVSSATITNGVSGNYGAGWATVDEDLYFSNNMSGMIYRIDNYLSSTPSAIPVLQGETTTGNDGAACPNAQTPIAEVNANNDNASITTGEVLHVQATHGLLSNDDHEGATISSYTQPANGTVVVEADGSYTYTPDEGFSGVDSFTYTLTDGFDNQYTATVTITVQAATVDDPEVVIPGAPEAGASPLHSALTWTAVVTLFGCTIARILQQRFNAR